MIIAVDFDGTLALGNYQYIQQLKPNNELIERLNQLKEIGAYIKIVTARGAKAKLDDVSKHKQYFKSIQEWLLQYKVPHDEISFNKEYADLYIDDMTISQYDYVNGINSFFTNNKIIFTDNSVIKCSKSAPIEHEWYKQIKMYINTPEVLFCNDSTIITKRIKATRNVTASDFYFLLSMYDDLPIIYTGDYETYINNIPNERIKNELSKFDLKPSFYHGDLSTKNVLIVNEKIYLIDPNPKVFGNKMTDCGKAIFSLCAYDKDFEGASNLAQSYGKDSWLFAAAEGIRVAKYRPEYTDIALNLLDIYESSVNI
jgi:hypothetical protein